MVLSVFVYLESGGRATGAIAVGLEPQKGRSARLFLLSTELYITI